MPTSVAGIVLAAGAGRRFGGPKALARLDGELLVERAFRLLTDGGCSPVVVVLGAAADQVLQAADLSDAVVVVNEDWDVGMSTSFHVGLRAAEGAGAAVVALVDQPWIRPEAVQRLIAAWQEGAVAALASYAGVPAHPVLLDASTWTEVAAMATGDAGARGWLRAHPELVVDVDCSGTGDPRDVDRPEDLPA